MSIVCCCIQALAAFGGGSGGPSRGPSKQDFYKPYRYVQDWSADTLYIGPTFRYSGGPVRVTLKFMETSLTGKLYAINPATGETIFLMNNTSPFGTAVTVTDLTSFKIGSEVVFMYITDWDGIPRYTGSSPPGDRYYNTLDSDLNQNPNLRFGHRWAVAGKVDDKIIEFGFEDGPPDISDMDFNDILFQVQGLELMIYQNVARKRYYIW
jgi:uncharacterized protein DUF4114